MRVATLAEIRGRTQREIAAYQRYGHSPDVTHLEFAVVLKALDDALAEDCEECGGTGVLERQEDGAPTECWACSKQPNAHPTSEGRTP